ncbi:MAG: LLM class flavin-dependent oxidoreductase [Acidimicrobiia bacterium]|nr:LLM class flavin-dependent oxidoreductase [Acidimicrobiia bacterium]
MIPSYQILLGNDFEGMSDKAFWMEEMRLAELTEPLGFSSIWCVEHHFDSPYSMSPDNLQVLAYLAGRTQRISLTTGAIILPWNDPLRVAEKIVVLDYLSNGRFQVGFGRGLAKMEYQRFGIDMNEARERFDEAAEIILEALRTGVMEADGKYYKQPRAEISPVPVRDFRDSLRCIAMSPDSLYAAAKLKARMATFIQFPIEQHAEMIDIYRGHYRELNGEDAPPPTLTEFVYCHQDPDVAAAVARERMARYFVNVTRHYNLDGGHFAETNGYQAYSALSDMINEAGLSEMAAAFCESQTYGTPEQILETVRHKRSVVGEYDLNCVFSYAGMPFDQAEASMRLFSETVMPELAAMSTQPAAAVTG